MAITFDHSITTELSNTDAQDRLKILTYNGTEFTNAYVAKQKDFDYFRDDAGVGDAIYFGWFWSSWHDLRLNITTPLVASSIDIVWEYENYDGSWQPLSVIDGSNMFQNSGSQTIEFTPPLGWKNGRAGNHYGKFIRARIVSASGLTEGGSNGILAPDGNDYAIQITGEENLDNIYAYDVANTLGLINKQGSVFTFYCNFRIGDKVRTYTEFSMIKETLQIGLTDAETPTKEKYYGKLGLFCQNSGDLWKMGDAAEKDGCTFIYNCRSLSSSPYNYFRCKMEWFNSLIQKNTGGYGEGGLTGGLKQFTNCIFSPYSVFFLIGIAMGSFFRNCTVDIGTTGYWYIYTNRFEFDNIQLTTGAGILGQGCTLKNTDFGSKRLYNYTRKNYLIDCNIDNLDTVFKTVVRASLVGGYVQYTMHIKTVDNNGDDIESNIKIENSLGETVYDGISDTDVLLTTFQETAGVPSGAAAVKVNFSPFKITITKSGFQTSELKQLFITEKKDLIIGLLPFPEPTNPIAVATETVVEVSAVQEIESLSVVVSGN